jgi:arginine N-succinyltransferase
MMRIRPIQARDLPALVRFAHESGHGFTSLPKHDAQLQAQIDRAEMAFKQGPAADGSASFLFVMEDVETGVVVGTSGIEARVGLHDALYHYHLSKVVHTSRELGIHNTVDVLTLCNDYTAATEICTLFLTQAARARHNGHLLSRFRFLFMAQQPQFFADTVIAEMRGESDELGRSPFWGWLQKHFFSMDLADAVHRVGMGQKSFIAELMPHYPVYVSLLDEPAQASIGQVHSHTAPALKMLEREGFLWRGYLDPFDAGPTVEARRKAIRTVAQSGTYQLETGSKSFEATHEATQGNLLVANDQCENFRATLVTGQINHEAGTIALSAAAQSLLQVSAGDSLRAIAT